MTDVLTIRKSPELLAYIEERRRNQMAAMEADLGLEPER